MTPAKRLHELVAEGVVGLALAAQARAVEGDARDVVDRAGVEVPVVGREQPRPADDVAGAERLDHDAARAGAWVAARPGPCRTR